MKNTSKSRLSSSKDTEMKELIEKLADIEHQRWVDWQKYLHSRGIKDNAGEGYLCLPMGLVEHWERQINTPYSELTEKEKQSDRNQVDRYLPLIKKLLEQQRDEVIRDCLSVLDKAETEGWFDMKETTENWKTWKRIRNTISDNKKEHYE